jgi:molybdopterin-guanine dinucleotide biosynthesis protein A
MTRGAIILCGGESKRMGRDKATLPFGPNETMLQRVTQLVSEVVPAEQIICVAAPGQQLPRLPPLVRIARDAEPHRGPLAGLAAGLAQWRMNDSRATMSTHAFCVLGCDSPLLVPAFITRMFGLLGNHQIAAPHDGERWHPLAAVYRADLLPRIKSLLMDHKRSLITLLDSCDTCRVAADQLRDLDPELNSLFSCNTLVDYETAIHSRAGATT